MAGIAQERGGRGSLGARPRGRMLHLAKGVEIVLTGRFDRLSRSRMMSRRAGWALQDFDNPVTIESMRAHLGLAPPHRSAPIDPLHFADFCAEMIERYAPAPRRAAVA